VPKAGAAMLALGGRLLVLGLLLSTLCWACVIQGHDSGECRSAAELTNALTFCGPIVKYTACVPKEYVRATWHAVCVYYSQQMPVDSIVLCAARRGDVTMMPLFVWQGAYASLNHNMQSKDEWVRETYLNITNERFQMETNSGYRKAGGCCELCAARGGRVVVVTVVVAVVVPLLQHKRSPARRET
jgi:hypothetical protein